MIRKIAMLTAVVCALAGLGATSASAQDDNQVKQESTDGGTTTTDAGTTTSYLGIFSISPVTFAQQVNYPNGQKKIQCTKLGADAGTKCPGL